MVWMNASACGVHDRKLCRERFGGTGATSAREGIHWSAGGDPHVEMRGATSRIKPFLCCDLWGFGKWRGDFRSVAGLLPAGGPPILLRGAPGFDRVRPWFRSMATSIPIGGSPISNRSPPSSPLVESLVSIGRTPQSDSVRPSFRWRAPLFSIDGTPCSDRWHPHSMCATCHKPSLAVHWGGRSKRRPQR